MTLSIIVPVYNAERYLSKCVDSLLEQDIPQSQYEILLVDDGATDCSGAICDEYASQHDCVQVIHQANGGIGAARNKGIDVAKGEYVMFVDSDDYLDTNVLKALLDKMEQDKLDVLRFDYRNVNEQYEQYEPNRVSRPFMDYRDEVCDGSTFLTHRLGNACYACQFVIRRSLTDGCRFKEGIIFEDTEWLPRLLMKTQRITSTTQIVYNYLTHSNSTTRGRDGEKRIRVQENQLNMIDYMQQQMQQADDKRWFKGMIAQITIGLLSRVSSQSKSERQMMIDKLKRKGVFPLSSYQSTRFAKRKIAIANLSPHLLCFLLHR